MKARVTQSGFVAGEYREAGEVLDLTERQFQTGIRRGRIEAINQDKPKDKNILKDEAEELRAELRKRGIEFHHKTGVAKLRDLLEESEGL